MGVLGKGKFRFGASEAPPFFAVAKLDLGGGHGGGCGGLWVAGTVAVAAGNGDRARGRFKLRRHSSGRVPQLRAGSTAPGGSHSSFQQRRAVTFRPIFLGNGQARLTEREQPFGALALLGEQSRAKARKIYALGHQ